MNSEQKFDEDDRRAVVRWLEERGSISLRRTKKYRKLFEDANGRLYLVLGAYDEWHGVPKKLLNMEAEKLDAAVLVIARRYPGSIEIFQGNLADLAQREDALHYMSGQCDFHTCEHSDQMLVKECTSVVLDKVGEFPFGMSEKAASKKRHQALELFKRLGPAEKAELLKKLSQALSR